MKHKHMNKTDHSESCMRKTCPNLRHKKKKTRIRKYTAEFFRCSKFYWVKRYTVYTRVINDPKFLATKRWFYHMLRVMNDSQTFGYSSQQKYFNIQWQQVKTLKHLYFKTTTIQKNQCNTINKKCSLDLDVAYRIHLDTTNILMTMI